MVAQGWTLFEEAVESAGAGDLPQLLHHLKGVTMPTPPPALASGPVLMDVPQPQEQSTPQPSPVKHEGWTSLSS